MRRQLLELSEQTGVIPAELLSDGGADVQSGIKRFCDLHPQTVGRKDLAHAAANFVKHELDGDATWIKFMQDASHAKAKMRQTSLAFLLPPELKAKARWMNLDSLLTWSRKVMGFIASPRPVPGVSLPVDELEKQMGWIRSYQEPLTAWSEMLDVTATSLKYIREHGYTPSLPLPTEQNRDKIRLIINCTFAQARPTLPYAEFAQSARSFHG